MTSLRRTTPILPSLLVLASLGALATEARAQRETRTRIDTTFAFNKGGSADLGLVSGAIVVTGWTRPEARIVASTERGTLETSFSQNHIAVQLRGDESRSRNRGNGETRYEVMVPIGTRVEARSVSGDIRIKATAAEVEANAVSGDVEVLDAADRVTIASVSGDAHAANLRGRVRVQSVSGDVEIDDVGGELYAKTVSGDMTLRRVNASQVRTETVSGEITYEGTMAANGTYEFNAHSGDIRLEIPQNVNASLEMETFSGRIRSAFPMTLQPGEDIGRRRGKKVESTIGAGGARIIVETFSGDIIIERTGRSAREDQ